MRNIAPNPFTHKANVDFSNICMKMKHHFPMKNVYDACESHRMVIN